MFAKHIQSIVAPKMGHNGKRLCVSAVIEKLQTLPIGYTKILSYDEAYDCIGDGWTVDIIAHILSFAEWS